MGHYVPSDAAKLRVPHEQGSPGAGGPTSTEDAWVPLGELLALSMMAGLP
jgi:hypothetical protein